MARLTLDDAKDRLRAVRRGLRAEGLDGLVVTDRANVRYLCGYEHEGQQLLVTRRAGYLVTPHRGVQRARRESVGFEVVDPKELPHPMSALARKHKLGTVGVDGRMSHEQFLRLRKQLRPARLKGTTVVREVRGVKSAGEIRLLRKAQRKAEGIFAAVLPEIRPGVTEQYIHNRIVQLILDDKSLEGPSFLPIASAGESSWTFHSRWTTRKLRKNDCLIIDMGVRYQGYCSDMTRTVFLGKPTRRMREVYGIVLEAQRRAIEAIRPGARGKDVAAAAWEFVGQQGYEQPHGLGHGVGLETHDPPLGGLGKGNKKPLQAGMVLTVEPGIYLKDAFGVRIEDTVVVTPGGCENLMRTPKELTIVG